MPNAELFQDFVLNFSSILWEAMPFIVLGAVIAGILEELLPQQVITRIMPRSAIPAVMLGGVLGLVFPMCECGIVVVMRRLLRKGVPLACCISYMLAGPIVNVVVLFSTFVAFNPHGIGWEMVALRAGLGFIIACLTGLVVHFLERKHGAVGLLKPLAMPPTTATASTENADHHGAPVPKKTIFKRLANISETAVHDFIDITVFLVLGSVLAAFAKMTLDPNQIMTLSREQPYLAIPAMMGLSIIMCLCSEADAFVAASFTEMSVSSKLAFLVIGPMLDLKLLLMYTRVFRLRLILTLSASSIILVLIASMIVHNLYNPLPNAFRADSTPASTAPVNPSSTTP